MDLRLWSTRVLGQGLGSQTLGKPVTLFPCDSLSNFSKSINPSGSMRRPQVQLVSEAELYRVARSFPEVNSTRRYTSVGSDCAMCMFRDELTTAAYACSEISWPQCMYLEEPP